MRITRLHAIRLIFIFATALLLSLSILSYLRINNIIRASAWVNHTNVVKLELETAFSSLVQAESAQRGYLITNDATYLDQFNKATNNAYYRLGRLKKLLSDNSRQTENVRLLQKIIELRIGHMSYHISLGDPKKIPADQKKIARRTLNQLKAQTRKIMAVEDTQLKIRTDSLAQQSAITPLFTILLIILLIIILTAAYYGIYIELKTSNTLRADLEANKKELIEANISLQKSNQEIALSRYNKRFLLEFSDRFSNYQVHNEFFNSMVQYIADLVHLDYVYVGKIEASADGDIVRTISVAAFGSLTDNFTYMLPDGPCEQISLGRSDVYTEDCRGLFPKSDMLRKFNVEGYVGCPLLDASGKSIGLIAVMHEKKIEDVETLESVLRVVARRTEIEMQRMQNADMLEEKNKILEDNVASLATMNKELESFTYISSHDLQEPLRKIQTFITRIIEKEGDVLSQSGRNYMARTQVAAHRMQSLIRDLLAYSRLKTEVFVIGNDSLRHIIADVKNDLDEELTAKDAIIEVTGDDHIKVIAYQFRQLLTNLISNSLKFARDGKAPVITIDNSPARANEIPELDRDTRYSKIIIADNGIGFDPQFRDRIFEVFQRLHNEQKYSGTGIGLAIVKKIVENHNGFVSADSRDGSGASFTVYLPA